MLIVPFPSGDGYFFLLIVGGGVVEFVVEVCWFCIGFVVVCGFRACLFCDYYSVGM